jgi:DNA polymerase-3 subunit gamma/tau
MPPLHAPPRPGRFPTLLVALALARKYRPKSFGSVAVQTHVSNTLRGAIAHGRIAHGYLLCGPRGTGKTTLARVLAMALNCERRAERDAAGGDTVGEPCGECASCRRIWSGSASLDVVEIDAASNRGVDDARDLRERAMYAPSGADRYKVYIVDEAHMLTREAWNALLKVLEEPPPRVVFVFATTEPQKIAQAAAPVLSRLQRFNLKRITPPEIRARLTQVLHAEGIEAEPEAIEMLTRAADGSMRDALSLTDQVIALDDQTALTADRVRDTLGLVSEDACLEVIDLIAERRAGDVFATVARLADAGIDLGAFLNGFTDMLRAQLAIALGGEAPDLSTHAQTALTARREAFSPGDLVRILSAITELEPRFRKSGQQQILLEALLVRCALLDRTVTLEAVLQSLGSGTSGRPSSAVRPPPAAPAKTNTPAPPPAAPVAAPPVARSGGALPPLSQASLAERWPAVIQRVRQLQGKKMLAVALEQAEPTLGSQSGEVIVRLTEANEIYERAIETGRSELAAALRDELTGVSGVRLARPDAPGSSSAPARRLTAESAKAEEVATLRRKDRVLGAAIDALDLELVDER